MCNAAKPTGAAPGGLQLHPGRTAAGSTPGWLPVSSGGFYSPRVSASELIERESTEALRAPARPGHQGSISGLASAFYLPLALPLPGPQFLSLGNKNKSLCPLPSALCPWRSKAV